MSKLPFGLKAPSKGTVIFVSVLSAISGTVYASRYYADEARKAHCNKVSFLADRPCGVHEMPRKIAVYIMAPPGDSMEKSRNWFREYIKPILVAGAVDYEIREGTSEGSIESSVCEEIKRLRREQQREQEQQALTDPTLGSSTAQEKQQSNPFAPMMQEVQKRIKEQSQVDGILAIGRLAWREVLNGVAKGCHADLSAPEPTASSSTEPTAEQSVAMTTDLHDNENNEQTRVDVPKEELIQQEQQIVEPESFETEMDAFSVPKSMSPVMYIPHENIIGWSNIPYRLYMWICDYKRVEAIGRYVVAAVLKETRPLEVRDLDQGESEKKYWIGDEAKEAVEKDTPITLEDRVREALKTYTSSELP